MFKITKKKLVAAAVGVAVVTSAGVGYAYWTSTGSGSGSASTGAASAVTVNQTSVVSAMGPGVAAQALSGTFTVAKPSFVGQVTASVSSTSDAGCTAADFTIVQPTATNAEIITGSTWGGGSIAFNDSSTTNQDACQGVTVNIDYSSN